MRSHTYFCTLPAPQMSSMLFAAQANNDWNMGEFWVQNVYSTAFRATVSGGRRVPRTARNVEGRVVDLPHGAVPGLRVPGVQPLQVQAALRACKRHLASATVVGHAGLKRWLHCLKGCMQTALHGCTPIITLARPAAQDHWDGSSSG